MQAGNLNILSSFLDAVGKPLQESESLKDHSHFKIGGNADYFFSVSSAEELVKAVCFARRVQLPYYILGGGFNLLFDDEGFRGLIIQNCAEGIEQSGDKEIEVASGTSLPALVRYCSLKELGGLEFLAGIPGTIGGAVYGNAGAFNRDIGSCVKTARILKTYGEVVTVDQAYFNFDYRGSILKTQHDVLLQITLGVYKAARHTIEITLEDIHKKRVQKHPPWEIACAGSYFKNPTLETGEKIPAASLLDQIGAKDMRVGGAAVYAHHANFIINTGVATSQDVLSLASDLKQRIKEKFNIELEEEVIHLPAEIP